MGARLRYFDCIDNYVTTSYLGRNVASSGRGSLVTRNRSLLNSASKSCAGTVE